MQLRYQFRVYPTPSQVVNAGRMFGCRRVVWNDALARQLPVKAANKLLGNPKQRLRQGPYQTVPKSVELSKSLITEAKKTTEREWLDNCPAPVLQQTLRDLDKAWAAHEDSKQGKRPGPFVQPPRFKTLRDKRQTARFTVNSRFKILANGKLRLPKIGDLEVRWTRDLPSDPTSVTLIKDSADRYFVSFVVETDPADDMLPTLPGDPDQGIDLGLTHFVVCADGSRIKSPRCLRRAEKKLKREQARLSRKKKGSNNRGKQRIVVARAHAHVANARRDFHHKLSTKLIRENQAVTVETLSVRALARGLHSKSVHDAGWTQFVNMLEYKAIRYGRDFTRVAWDFPSSQVCSTCGFRDGPKPLHIREWTCGNCGTTHDRDWNAGKNIKYEGRRIRAARQVEPSTPGPGALAGQPAR